MEKKELTTQQPDRIIKQSTESMSPEETIENFLGKLACFGVVSFCVFLYLFEDIYALYGIISDDSFVIEELAKTVQDTVELVISKFL